MEEIIPPSPPPLLRPSPRPTHSVRSEGGRSGSPDSANLRGTLRREEERVTLEEEELRRRAEEERARQPPPAEPEPTWAPSLEERLAAILAAGLQRDPKGFTLPKAPEEFSAYVTRRNSINSALLSSGDDPVSTLRFIRELEDLEFPVEDLQNDLTPSMQALDIRLFAEIEKALQAGTKATQYLGEVQRICTISSGLYGCGRRAVRILNDLYRQERQTQIAAAYAALEENHCGDMAGLPSFLDTLSRNLFILEKCEEPMKEGQVRRQLENKLAGVQGVSSTLELFAALKEGHEDKTSSALLARLQERAAAHQEKEEAKQEQEQHEEEQGVVGERADAREGGRGARKHEQVDNK